MTSTQMPRAMAQPGSLPMSTHMMMVSSARPMTAGTKTADTLSAILASGAFVAAASETILIIWESVVSSPTLDALHLIYPD